MNDEKAPQTYQEDETPTQPVAKPGDWEMPQPVFRQSSGGTLPRRLGVRIDGEAYPQTPADNSGGNASTGAAVAPAAEPVSAAAAVPIAEQPDLTEEFAVPDEGLPAVPPKQRSATMRIVLIVLALAAMLAVIGAFLVVVYMLFFSRVSESQTF